MLESIKNINLEGTIKKDEIFNLYKTKSSNINSLIMSKIDSHTTNLDFFAEYTDFDINYILKSIDNINNRFSNIFIPNLKFSKDELEQYINVLSTIILTIHYILKIKSIFCQKLKEFQQNLIKGMITENLEEAYKEKIIEYNTLSNSALKSLNKNQNQTCFSNFIGNKPKIFNHFDPNSQRYFSKDPTPKFNIFEKEPKSPFNKNITNYNTNNNNNEDSKEFDEKFEKEKKKYSNHKPKNSNSSLSMSSILVINNEELEKPMKKTKNRKQNARKSSHFTPEKKNFKLKKEKPIERKIVSDKILLKNQLIDQNEEKNIFYLINGNKGNKYIDSDEENIIQKDSCKTVLNKEINNIRNKELFVELLKFANDLFKEKLIDESQKKFLKQLIINYMASKHNNNKK